MRLLITALTKRETERLKWCLRLVSAVKIKNHVPLYGRKKTKKRCKATNHVLRTHSAIKGAVEERLEVRAGKKGSRRVLMASY